MTSSSFQFIHLTDLHIDHQLTGSDGTADNIEYVVQRILSMNPQPRFVIMSGDLVDSAHDENYRRLHEYIGRLGLPVLLALGNHDDREAFHRSMGDREAGDASPYFFSTILERMHVIVLDSSTPGRIGGTIEPEQFAWLEAELDRHPDLPKLIVSHHPPSIGEVPDPLPLQTIDFAQSQRLGTLLAGRNILGVLCGHVHHDRISMWNGIPVIVGTGLHTSIDVLFNEGVIVVRGASFTLCTVRPSGLTATFIPLPSDRAELRRIYDRDRTVFA